MHSCYYFYYILLIHFSFLSLHSAEVYWCAMISATSVLCMSCKERTKASKTESCTSKHIQICFCGIFTPLFYSMTNIFRRQELKIPRMCLKIEVFFFTPLFYSMTSRFRKKGPKIPRMSQNRRFHKS